MVIPRFNRVKRMGKGGESTMTTGSHNHGPEGRVGGSSQANLGGTESGHILTTA